MKTEFNIIIIMAILISTTFFLIYRNPNEVPNSLLFQKYANEILHINEKSKSQLDDVQKFNQSKTLMQEKLKEISWDLLGIKISDMALLEGQYPFVVAKDRAEKLDLDPSLICTFEQNIPMHLKTISETDNFQIFAKKYSSHTLELIIMDERSKVSNIHYGLTTTNNKNQHASTYFHLDSCTNERTDKEPYFLRCSDENNDYQFATFNHDDIISSYSNGHFCKIELDSWRQSLYDYSKTLREKLRQLELQSMTGIVDQESQWEFISEMNKQGYLGNLVGDMIHDNLDDHEIQEKIRQYENKYGSIPKELSELIERR